MKSSNEPSPTEADISRIDSAFYDLTAADELSNWFGDYYRNHRCRLAIDLRILREAVSEGIRVVEFGSTPCLLTHAMSSAGFHVTGVDLDPGRIIPTSRALEILSCDIEREPVPLQDGIADVVLFNEVFEHLRIDPIFTLREVARVMKPGGLLLLSTPNMRSLAGIRSLLLENRSAFLCPLPFDEYQKLRLLGHMGHVREYTTRDVIEFLQNFELTTEQIIYRSESPRFRWLQRLMPHLRPFFTVVARRLA